MTIFFNLAKKIDRHVNSIQNSLKYHLCRQNRINVKENEDAHSPEFSSSYNHHVRLLNSSVLKLMFLTWSPVYEIQ